MKCVPHCFTLSEVNEIKTHTHVVHLTIAGTNVFLLFPIPFLEFHFCLRINPVRHLFWAIHIPDVVFPHQLQLNIYLHFWFRFYFVLLWICCRFSNKEGLVQQQVMAPFLHLQRFKNSEYIEISQQMGFEKTKKIFMGNLVFGLAFQKGEMAASSTHEHAQATFVANSTKHFKLHPYFPRLTETRGSLCTTTATATATTATATTANFKMLQVNDYHQRLVVILSFCVSSSSSHSMQKHIVHVVLTWIIYRNRFYTIFLNVNFIY